MDSYYVAEGALREYYQYGYNETVLNLFAIVFIILMILYLLICKKSNVFIPFLLTALFITQRQRFVIADLDFTMLRILLVFVLIRNFIKSEHRGIKFNVIDQCIVLMMILMTLTYTTRLGTLSAFVNRLGMSFDAMGFYFLTRIYLDKLDTIDRLFKMIAILIVPISVFMICEQITGKNIFAIFGGVNEYSLVRNGRIRAQGAFSHPILAGTFGAMIIPIFIAEYFKSKSQEKRYYIVGIAASIVMVAASASSGPILSFMAGILGLIIWYLRSYLKLIRYAIVMLIIMLHFLMKAPVWHLISRIDIAGGSTGWHRFYLIDQTIKRFNEWWLLGVNSTGHWGYGLQDVTNMYIAVAVNGGIFSLIIFLVIIYLCLKGVGKCLDNVKNNKIFSFYFWSFGIILFVHLISFIGVTYFGQIVFFWYLTLGILSNFWSITTIDKKSNRLPTLVQILFFKNKSKYIANENVPYNSFPNN